MRIMIAYFLSAFLVVSCAVTGTPTNADEKVFVRIVETNQNAKSAYNKALQYFAENLGNSNQAIQIKDQADAHIVTNMKSECNFKNSFDQEIAYTQSYSVDFRAKDNRAKIQYKVISNTFPSAAGAIEHPVYKEQLPALNACIDKLSEELIAMIATKQGNDW